MTGKRGKLAAGGRHVGLGCSAKALMLILRKVEDDSSGDDWRSTFDTQRFFFLIISGRTCREIGVNKIVQILHFCYFGRFISFRHSDGSTQRAYWFGSPSVMCDRNIGIWQQWWCNHDGETVGRLAARAVVAPPQGHGGPGPLLLCHPGNGLGGLRTAG